jgi:hypothetical protein
MSIRFLWARLSLGAASFALTYLLSSPVTPEINPSWAEDEDLALIQEILNPLWCNGCQFFLGRGLV